MLDKHVADKIVNTWLDEFIKIPINNKSFYYFLKSVWFAFKSNQPNEDKEYALSNHMFFLTQAKNLPIISNYMEYLSQLDFQKFVENKNYILHKEVALSITKTKINQLAENGELPVIIKPVIYHLYYAESKLEMHYSFEVYDNIVNFAEDLSFTSYNIVLPKERMRLNTEIQIIVEALYTSVPLI